MSRELCLLVWMSLCCASKSLAQPRYMNFVREDGSLISGSSAFESRFQRSSRPGQELEVSAGYKEQKLTTIVVNANFTQEYTENVNVEHQYLFIYTYNETNTTTAVRVSASSENASEQFPVMFVVRQQEGILSWQLPIFIDYTFGYPFVSRTLCPVDKFKRSNMSAHQSIYIDVSTMAQGNVSFNLTAEQLEHFQLHHGKTSNITVSPSEPQYFMYEFPEGVETVLLRVNSEDNLCTVVSVQKIKCPIFDLDRNIGYEGKHQTMTTQASIFLERDDYGEYNAFYLVISVKPNNVECDVPDQVEPPDRSYKKYKHLSISISATIPSSQYYVAVFAALAVFVSFYVVAAAIGCIYHCCGCHRSLNDLTDAERDQLLCFNHGDRTRSQSSEIQSPESSGAFSDDSHSLLRGSGISGYGAMASVSDSSTGRPPRELHRVEGSQTSVSRQSSDLDFDTSDIDFLPDADSEKDVVRTKTVLFVSDLSRKSHKKLSKTFKIYHWNLLTVGIFYGLPVVQLVLTYQQQLLRTGDQDLCYYNFACAHPFRYFSAFNNVVSNMGYVLLGALFVILVWRRDLLHRSLLKESSQLEREYGIPQHYGLLYAMGLALIMEGIMSACYHVCPNYTNFQFDTSFMYIIACLCMLRIYETRHPDVQAKAYKSYFSMAVIIFIAVLGVVYGTNIFWIFYALIHMFSTLVLSVQIYYVGRISVDRYVFTRMARLIISECFNCVRPIYPNRFVMLLIGNLINWAFALYGAIKHPSDFASFLLAILIGNLLLYVLFYIVMKLFNKERINALTIMVIVTSCVTWAASLFFFFQHLTSSQESPAVSREGNRPCVLLDFYDTHDVWHFLSAISLFLSFLILLTLDDSLALQRRDRIPVF